MNTKSYANAHIRIASLKQKIFWRYILSLLFCVLPPSILGACTGWVIDDSRAAIFFASFFALIGFIFWLSGSCDDVANFLFEDGFRVKAKRFLENEEAGFRAQEHERRKKHEAKEAEMIAALEQDMRATGILIDPTEKTTS